jgi:hypothetical protein
LKESLKNEVYWRIGGLTTVLLIYGGFNFDLKNRRKIWKKRRGEKRVI